MNNGKRKFLKLLRFIEHSENLKEEQENKYVHKIKKICEYLKTRII